MSELTPLERHDQDLAEHARHQSSARAYVGGIIAVLAIVVFCIVTTFATNLTFGFFKVLFGVGTGIAVKYTGRGTGSSFGHIAGWYAVLAVVMHESLFSALFIERGDPSLLPDRFDGSKEAMQSAYGIARVIREIATAGFAYGIAYRIAKNPMKKDELDYLLEAKGVGEDDAKYSSRYFKNKQRR